MTLKARITEDMKAAMRAKDSARLSTIRLLLAAIKQREVDERIELTDADVLASSTRWSSSAATRSRSSRPATAPTWPPIERAEVDVLQALPAGAG